MADDRKRITLTTRKGGRMETAPESKPAKSVKKAQAETDKGDEDVATGNT